MLNGHIQIAASDVKDHHACALGQWYTGKDSQRWKQLPAFQQLGATHERFHKRVTEIVTLWNSGTRGEAHERFVQLTSLTEEIFELLDRISIEAAKA